KSNLEALLKREDARRSNLDETVAHFVTKSAAVQSGSMLCSELDHAYRHDAQLDQMVILAGEQPIGLLTRQHFYDRTGGPVGYSLFSRRSIEEVATHHFLMVESSTHVPPLAALAMERMRQELYEPVVVVDNAGKFLGTVTIKQLIMRSAELEIQSAAGANPL